MMMAEEIGVYKLYGPHLSFSTSSVRHLNDVYINLFLYFFS